MTNASYEAQLNSLLDKIFAATNGDSDKMIAAKCGISAITAYRLRYRLTRFPRLQTVMKLARGYHLRFTLVDDVRLRRVG